MEEDTPTIKLKITVVGGPGVGKSCLVGAYSALRTDRTKSFDQISKETQSTIGCDFVGIKLPLDGKIVRMNVWDTAGQEKYQTINKNLYLGARGAMICFDLTAKLEKDELEFWRRKVAEYAGSKCRIMLIGTKSDSEVLPETRESLEKYAKSVDVPYFETSAKTGINVEEAFKTMADEIITKDAEDKRLKEAAMTEAEREEERKRIAEERREFYDISLPKNDKVKNEKCV